MIKINRGTDINSAYGLILKALYSRGYTGIEEGDEEGKEIFVSKVRLFFLGFISLGLLSFRIHLLVLLLVL